MSTSMIAVVVAPVMLSLSMLLGACAATPIERSEVEQAAEVAAGLIIEPQVCTCGGPIDASGGCYSSCPGATPTAPRVLVYAPTCCR